MSSLACQSPNYKKALKEGRVGRPAAKKTQAFEDAYEEWKEGKITATEAIRRAGVSRATFYKMVKKENL